MNAEVRTIVATIVSNTNGCKVPGIENAVDRVNALLQKENCDDATCSSHAVMVRDILWGTVLSNDTANRVTRGIYAALGRSKECSAL